MAWRVPQAVPHRQLAAAQLHGVAVMQPARGREGARGRQAEQAALLGQRVDPELVGRMRADDGNLPALGQLRRAARVVDVAVREPDLPGLQAQRLRGLLDARQIAAGVNHGRLARCIAPQQRTVLRKSRYILF